MEEDKVTISDSGMAYKEFKELYAVDKRPHKPYFKEVIKGIFLIYSLNSPIPVTGMPYVERVEMAQEQWLEKRWDKLIKSPKVRACIDLYKRITYRKDRDMIIKVMEDMDKFLRHLNSIPTTKEIKVKIPRKNEVTGETEYINGKETVYNFEEKMKVYEQMDKLQMLYEKFEEKLKMEHNAVNKNQKMFEIEKEVPPKDVQDYSHVTNQSH